MKNDERLDIEALVEGVLSIDDFTQEGFVGVPHHKGSLHPSVYFADLFLLKSNANGVSREEINNCLGITENFFNEFLQCKVSVNLDVAKQLIFYLPSWAYELCILKTKIKNLFIKYIFLPVIFLFS